MSETIDVEAVKSYLHDLANCCMRGEEVDLIDHIVEVRHFEESVNDGPSGGVIALLGDGRWIAVEDSQDYTGHGCQCGTDSSVHPSYEEAVRMGIGEGLRQSFGCPDPDVTDRVGEGQAGPSALTKNQFPANDHCDNTDADASARGDGTAIGSKSPPGPYEAQGLVQRWAECFPTALHRDVGGVARERLIELIAAALRASGAALADSERVRESLRTDLVASRANLEAARAEATKAAETVVLAVGLTIEQGAAWSQAFKVGAATAVEEIAYRLQHPEAPYPAVIRAPQPPEPATLTPEMERKAARVQKFTAPLPDEPESGPDPDYGLLSSPGDPDASVYACDRCGALRSKNEGGTTFTVCDVCWEVLHPPANAPAPDRPSSPPPPSAHRHTWGMTMCLSCSAPKPDPDAPPPSEWKEPTKGSMTVGDLPYVLCPMCQKRLPRAGWEHTCKAPPPSEEPKPRCEMCERHDERYSQHDGTMMHEVWMGQEKRYSMLFPCRLVPSPSPTREEPR